MLPQFNLPEDIPEPSDLLPSGLVAVHTWCTAAIFEDDSSLPLSWGISFTWLVFLGRASGGVDLFPTS